MAHPAEMPAAARSRPRKARATRTPKRLPADSFRLTPAERAMLPDPEWVTEDDADAIFAYRHRREPTISLEEYLRKAGR